MAEIDSLGTNYYYSGVQSSTNEALKKNQKKEKASSTKKTKFSELLKAEANVNEANTLAQGLPLEIAGMEVEEAAIYLKDAVDIAGNELSEELSKENIENFKTAVRQFMTFVINNNFEVSSHRKKNRLGKDRIVPSRSNFFSNYSLPPHRIDPRYQIQVINEKLDALTRATLETQMNNLKILAQVNEIKGLIIDLMSS
ncbi:MAG: YaaR family protein [Treponema sp.]|nr:YaaR family protein [Treponema sp.]